MKMIQLLCLIMALLLTSLSASAQQMPWKGSLDSLDEFTGLIDLSDRKIAQRILIASLSDPNIQLESVSIHAYTRADACQEAFLWRRLANNYGALSLVSDGDDIIQKEWFDQLDTACDPDDVDPVQCVLSDRWSAGNVGEDDDRGCIIAWHLKRFVESTGAGKSTNQFIYTTAPLPYATPLAELRGLCGSDTYSSGHNNSACSRKLSLR
ncbi:MAG: hypothetical protein OXC91_02520 [Rhodobacteraceae bacterium]|nr:hypothetical protein [Paracoccaceae bacterium]